MSEHPGRNCLK